MPPRTTLEHQRERNRRRSKAYRERHPERARAARRRTDAIRRGNPDYKPRKVEKKEPCKTETNPKQEARVSLLRQRFAILKARKDAATRKQRSELEDTATTQSTA